MRCFQRLVFSGMVMGACGTPSSIELDASPADGSIEPDASEELPTGCPSGTHDCAGSCVANGPDDPTTGCALGCGSACPPVANGVATCTPEGTCGVSCDAGFAAVGGQCSPTACESANYVCGSFVDGNGATIECGACDGGSIILSCNADHTCNIAPDTYEPNNTASTATMLPSYTDGSYTIRTYYAQAHESGDEDWFQFHVEDVTNFLAEPEVAVEMDPESFGNGTGLYELTVWARCDHGDDGLGVGCFNAFLSGGTRITDPILGTGCVQESGYLVRAEAYASCMTTDDSITVVARVRPLDAVRGERYKLKVVVQ